jgi:transcriptional regulator GlxA family with amidase domain
LVTTFGVGVRGTTLDLRLRWATRLLSVKELSLREVSKASGYSSVEALGRAFRDASLPSPTQARAILAESDEAWPSGVAI